MTVRPAEPRDRLELYRLGTRFIASSAFTQATGMSLARVESIVASVTEHGHALVVELAPGRLVGMFGFQIGPHPISGLSTAFEVAWFVHEDARGSRAALELVKDAEAVSLGAGARQMQIGAPDARVGAFLERLGYRAIETTYVKDLG